MNPTDETAPGDSAADARATVPNESPDDSPSNTPHDTPDVNPADSVQTDCSDTGERPGEVSSDFDAATLPTSSPSRDGAVLVSTGAESVSVQTTAPSPADGQWPAGLDERSDDLTATPGVRDVPPLVLVAHSDETVRHVLGRAVGRAGYRPRLVADLRATLQEPAAEAFDADCILVDLGDPEQPSEWLASSLKDSSIEVPTVVVSGLSPEKVAQRLAPLEPSGVLAKPFNRSELEGLLVELLGGAGEPTDQDLIDPETAEDVAHAVSELTSAHQQSEELEPSPEHVAESSDSVVSAVTVDEA